MANLQSPGVQVQVIDESFYLPAAPGTTPMLFVASAQDKKNPSGSTAEGTTAANAGKIWLITSQRDLVETFGTPLFYTDASSNPRHGDELNEYGLQAAYSVLGVSSRAYVVRADLNTTQLVPTSSTPTGGPVAGTFWLDSDASVFGVKEWSSSTQKFTVKTPLVLDDNSPSTDLVSGAPTNSFGSKGDYCMVLPYSTSADVGLFYKTTTNVWVPVENGFDSGKALQISPHYTYPTTFNSSTATGSVWITTTTPSNGAKWSLKYYNGSTQTWGTVNAPIYSGNKEAIYALDSSGGGKNIPLRTVYIDSNPDNLTAETARFEIKQRNVAGATIATGNATTNLSVEGSYTFTLKVTTPGSNSWSVNTATITPLNTTTVIASLIPAAISSLGLSNVSAAWNASTNKLTVTHAAGGDIMIDDGTNTPIDKSGFSTTGLDNVYVPPSGETGYNFLISNWKPLVYQAKASAPTTDPADGTLWYNNVVGDVDIMIHDGSKWVGYKNSLSSTNSTGPLIAAVEPTEQSDGTGLETGDIWIDTSNPDEFGRKIYVYNSTNVVGKRWVLQDVTDQSSPDGWLFADARWATTGTTLTASSIVDLLSSNYVDPDAPDPALYPKGMRLWNTRRSGFNVKKYIVGHIDIEANEGRNIRMNNESMSNYKSDRWVSQYPVAADGGPQFGRLSQRAQVVNALKEVIDSNTSVRDTDTLVFNLLAAPGYPEAIQNLIGLNTDRKLTAFVVGDTPFRLVPNATALSQWALNSNNALDNGDKGATSYDEYMGMWYPSGYTNDNTGNNIVVPPSHMMLRTIINSDNKSYQWFAPAGTRRGGVDNATSVGYITDEGEFKPVALYEGLRDTLYNAKVNPIATLTGVGVVAYGQKTRARNASALDRVNVARLVVYLRRQLDIMARPFLFEPNDAQTRREIKAAAESLLLELVGQRALYDFIVVCDETNNTPSRIDRNELWLDIAIEPVKAIEFIYIPVRLKNTGDIAAGL
jgi:hypothetical protein